MDDQLQRYEKYASGVKRLLLLAGLWPGRSTSKLYRSVGIVYLMLSVFTTSGIMSFVFDHITNLNLVTMGLGPAVSCCTAVLKVILFSIYHDHLVELHETLETSFRKELADPELRPVLLSPLEFFYRSTLWLSVSTWMIVLIYNLTPPLSIIIQRLHGVETVKYRTPYPTEYPWSFAGNILLYSAQYISEITTGFGVGAITTSTDALFGFYVFQMASQFRTLSYRMANLTATDDYHTVMKECITRRQMLAHCRDKLQTVYGPIVIWMLIASAMTICTNIFQASQISIDKVMLVFVYIIMKLIQTLLYGWYGLFLTTESEAFRDSVYCSGWPDSNDRFFSSSVLIMLMYKPLVLKACNLSVISLDMFIAVLNTAMSYFFLLQTLDEK